MLVDQPGTERPSFLRELPLARRAHAFARSAHGEQRRESDAAWFIVHPLEVAALRSRATRGEHVLDPGNEPARAKLEHYLQSLSMLEQITPEHPLVRQLRFELEMLEALPPRPELLPEPPWRTAGEPRPAPEDH